MPAIPIPLYRPDADVNVALQKVFAETFARGGYEERRHYNAPPRTRLSQADRQCAAELAAAARRDGE